MRIPRSALASEIELAPLLPAATTPAHEHSGDRLPTDILPHIFSHLTEPRDRVAVGQVNRTWRSMRPDPLPECPVEAVTLFDENYCKRAQSATMPQLIEFWLQLAAWAAGLASLYECFRLQELSNKMGDEAYAFRLRLCGEAPYPWTSEYADCIDSNTRSLPEFEWFSANGLLRTTLTIVGAATGAAAGAAAIYWAYRCTIRRRLAGRVAPELDSAFPDQLCRKAASVPALAHRLNLAVKANDHKAIVFLHNLRVPLTLSQGGVTPLESALVSRSHGAVRALLQNGVSPTGAAVQLSLTTGTPEQLTLMLGAVPVGPKQQELALACAGAPAVAAARDGLMESLNLVLTAAGERRGELLNTLAADTGYGPLHTVAHDSRVADFITLLGAGAQPDLLSATRPAVSARMRAVGHPRVLDALRAHDANSPV